LGVDLLRRLQVLQRAAAAHAEVRATRLDAVRRGPQHLQRLRLVEAAAARSLLHAHAFARQRAGDEHGLARVGGAFGAAGDAAAVVAEVEDLELEGGLVDAGHGWGACGARDWGTGKRGIKATRALRAANSKGSLPCSPFPVPGRPWVGPTSASRCRRTGTTSRCARWRSTAARTRRGSATPTPGGRWRPRPRGTRPCGRGCRPRPPG